MHSGSLDQLTYPHVFLGLEHDRNERRTWFVVGLTFSMMVAEIVGGSLFGSLALIADGWHMSTHAAALTISAMAYRYARRHATDRRFAFGTGKLGDLAGYTSAVVLGMIALLIAYQSLDRLLHPVSIAYGEAVAIATLGLAVNLISAWLLRDEHHHHDHDVNGHHGHDRDLKSSLSLYPRPCGCGHFGSGDRRPVVGLGAGLALHRPADRLGRNRGHRQLGMGSAARHRPGIGGRCSRREADRARGAGSPRTERGPDDRFSPLAGRAGPSGGHRFAGIRRTVLALILSSPPLRHFGIKPCHD